MASAHKTEPTRAGGSPVPFSENTLLNTPSLVALLLRAAAGGTPSIRDCAARLEALLARAGEHPDVSAAAIRRRLDALRRQLATARLIAPAGEGRFTLTDRGREALATYPEGFTLGELMRYPEFAASIRRIPAGIAPTGSGAYDQGFAARQSGRPPTANPHPADTAAHLDWENGWSEALDEDPPPSARDGDPHARPR